MILANEAGRPQRLHEERGLAVHRVVGAPDVPFFILAGHVALDFLEGLGTFNVNFKPFFYQLRNGLGVMDALTIHFQSHARAGKHLAESPTDVEVFDLVVLTGIPKVIMV